MGSKCNGHNPDLHGVNEYLSWMLHGVSNLETTFCQILQCNHQGRYLFPNSPSIHTSQGQQISPGIFGNVKPSYMIKFYEILWVHATNILYIHTFGINFFFICNAILMFFSSIVFFHLFLLLLFCMPTFVSWDNYCDCNDTFAFIGWLYCPLSGLCERPHGSSSRATPRKCWYQHL